MTQAVISFVGHHSDHQKDSTSTTLLLNKEKRKQPSSVINSLLMLIQNILEVQEINKKSLQPGWKTNRDHITNKVLSSII